MPGGNAWRKMTQVNSDSGKKLTQVKKLTQAKTDSGKKCPKEMPGGNAQRKCLEENDSGK